MSYFGYQKLHILIDLMMHNDATIRKPLQQLLAFTPAMTIDVPSRNHKHQDRDTLFEHFRPAAFITC